MSIFDKYDLVDVDKSVPSIEIPSRGLIVIVGTSGSGKTTILKDCGVYEDVSINAEKPIYKNFKTDMDAEKWLIAAGLRSVPAWLRTIESVSNGERHRAEIAIRLSFGCASIDEFTSLVDRDTARALCESINKVKGELNRLVLSTCHKDVLQWLDFDFAYDTDLKQWIDRGSLRQDREITLEIESCDTKKVWEVFRKHHYLSGKINKSANSFVAYIDSKPVAMTSVIPMPSGTLKDAWRGHRTVVLPEFQGMGIGTAISDAVADMVISSGARFFSKTAHPAMGEHREKSSKWKPTSKNKKSRKDYDAKRDREWTNGNYKETHKLRVCYSHEYIG